MTGDKIIAIIKAKLPSLASKYGIRRIGLFGSVNTERFAEDSDIDLIVEFARPIGFRFHKLTEELEDLLGRKVDILTPDGVNSIRIPTIADSIRRTIVYV